MKYFKNYRRNIFLENVVLYGVYAIQHLVKSTFDNDLELKTGTSHVYFKMLSYTISLQYF